MRNRSRTTSRPRAPSSPAAPGSRRRDAQGLGAFVDAVDQQAAGAIGHLQRDAARPTRADGCPSRTPRRRPGRSPRGGTSRSPNRTARWNTFTSMFPTPTRSVNTCACVLSSSLSAPRRHVPALGVVPRNRTNQGELQPGDLATREPYPSTTPRGSFQGSKRETWTTRGRRVDANPPEPPPAAASGQLQVLRGPRVESRRDDQAMASAGGPGGTNSA